MIATGGASNSGDSSAVGLKSPKKGILKKRTSIEDASHAPLAPRASSGTGEKSARWDEMNILQTYHPADKDYGHMKIDEPKTPYNYDEEEAAEEDEHNIPADELQRRIEEKALHRHGSHVSLSSDDDLDETQETPEHKAHRKKFEEHRRKHYNEGHLLKDAKRLVQEELEQLAAEEEAAMEVEQSAPPQRTKVTSSYTGPQPGTSV